MFEIFSLGSGKFFEVSVNYAYRTVGINFPDEIESVFISALSALAYSAYDRGF